MAGPPTAPSQTLRPPASSGPSPADLPPLGSRPPPRRRDGPASVLPGGLPAAEPSAVKPRPKPSFGDTQRVPEALVPGGPLASSGLGAATGQLGAALDEPTEKDGPSEWPVARVSGPTAVAPVPPPLPSEDEPATIRHPVSDAPSGGGYVRRSASQRPPTKSVRPSAPPSIPRAPGVPGDAARASSRLDPAELERLRRALERAEERAKSLARQLDAGKADLTASNQKRRETAASLDELKRSHDKLESQHDSLRALVAVRAERIRELERMVEQRDAELRSLERTRDAATLAHMQEIEALRETMRDEKQRAIDLLQASVQEQLRLHSRPPPAPNDDLRQMKGIGPKFEKALHALGITRFAQIAAWTDEDVSTYADKLGTTAKRILRDGWVESARKLSGEPPEPDDAASSAETSSGAGPIESIRPNDEDEVEGSW